MTPEPNLKDRIIGMMQENTGANMLDSGGADGRGWQRNNLITDFDNTPVVELDVYEDGVIPAYSVYHYLMNFLEITPQSEKLNAALAEFMDASDNPHVKDVQDFIKTIDHADIFSITNTYNSDNILSQILNYTIFESEHGEYNITGGYYIALQVHNGADARGGYTVPQIFYLGSDDAAAYFEMAQTQVYTACDCGNWDSDDAGNTYYKDGTSPSPDPEWIYETEKNRVMCRKCGKEVNFSVIESW